MNTEQIKILKYSRLEPEEQFLFDIFSRCTINVYGDGYEYHIRDANNTYLTFIKKDKTVYLNFDKVFVRFSLKFNLNHKKAHNYIRSYIEKFLKFEVDQMYNI